MRRMSELKPKLLCALLGGYLLFCWQDVVRTYGWRWFSGDLPRGLSILPEWVLHSVFLDAFQGAGLAGAMLLMSAPVLSRRVSRLGALLGWLWLVHLSAGNRYFYEIHFDYLGWMLLGFCILDPLNREKRIFREFERLALLVIGISYTAAGLVKLTSPVWMGGDAMRALMPAVRIAGLDFSNPLFTAIVALTQAVALPLILFRRSAPWGWLFVTLLQLSLFALFRIERITFPVLLFHGLAWQPGWRLAAAWVGRGVRGSGGAESRA